MILWEEDDPPPYWEDYADRAVRLPDIGSELAGVQWYRKLAGPLRTMTVHAAFVPPQAAEPDPGTSGPTPER